MKATPRWIIELIERDRLDCSSCKERFFQKDLMSIGVQESTQKPHNDTLVIGLFCKKCNELTIFELKEMTLVDLAFMILEEESDQHVKIKEDSICGNKVDSKKKKYTSKSKITLREIKETSDFLKKIKTHDEFLAALGMSPEEIEKYKK